MPPVRASRNLRELPKFRDGLSYLYVERAVIEQEAKAVALYDERGVTFVPAAALGVLFLGPGTRITHAAIKSLADNGCTVVWVGEGMARFYASGLGKTRGAARFLQQARAWSDPRLHLEVVRRLYLFRFPQGAPPDATIPQLRGLEGVRVRSTYSYWSTQTGVPWSGRFYDRGNWQDADVPNRALSAGASYLYGLAHSAIVASGYSPSLGFIHTGKLLSFVYDVADLYKTDVLVPCAFLVAAESDTDVERRMRRALRNRFAELRLLERMVNDLLRLFEGLASATDELESRPEDYDEDLARPGPLWDPRGSVEGGKSYGSNDVGESTQESER
jgi:CRISPR-associated protein Cas1